MENLNLDWLYALTPFVLGGLWKLWRKLDKKISTLDSIASIIEEANVPEMKVKIDNIEQSILTLCRDQNSVGMKLKFLFENERQAVFELGSDGKLFWANGAFLDLLEIPSLEAATGSEWIWSFDPESAEALRKKIHSAHEVGKSFNIRVKDNKGRHLLLNAYVIKDSAYALSGWIGALVVESADH